MTRLREWEGKSSNCDSNYLRKTGDREIREEANEWARGEQVLSREMAIKMDRWEQRGRADRGFKPRSWADSGTCYGTKQQRTKEGF